ncbi:hypothetical protein GCM10023200_21160 [Actinomycetospora chlora]|uniref:Uncharacterized protein n=1 Tax=Actinomycetospora chlora TaxID=663608 RepID=A0ABP9AZI6_9PSEU
MTTDEDLARRKGERDAALALAGDRRQREAAGDTVALHPADDWASSTHPEAYLDGAESVLGYRPRLIT